MTEEEEPHIMGTRFHGKDGKVILFLQHDPVAVIIPEGVTADEAAREFARIVNEYLLPQARP
jgi:hypothetical protein